MKKALFVMLIAASGTVAAEGLFWEKIDTRWMLCAPANTEGQKRCVGIPDQVITDIKQAKYEAI